MFLLEGVIALFAAFALYTLASFLHHRETSPAWLRGQLFASVVGMSLVAIVPAGVGLVTYGLGEPMTTASRIGLAGLALLPLAMVPLVRAVR
ncbi:hypothetical protein [Maliponia aquimaris]|uniref:Uncharacterized protein n=1 Tax=Maliponia aquimaris TaxID=1673631 RepID=A0A238KBF3_9RHOB|nr:hypothetical protein [Maliponia aquimaris]SMX40171.1 hypothetical protein MAA8898_02061 [Maliponia aquimaris]